MQTRSQQTPRAIHEGDRQVRQWTAVGIAVVAAATLEFVWQWVNRRLPA